MLQRLSFMLLGALISCTALGAGLDPIRVGRYSAIMPGPSPEQADPFALPIHMEFPYSVQTVGEALGHVLSRSGYRLASPNASCPSLPVLLGWPLPAVHRSLGPMRLDEALKTLAGPAHYLVVDPVHRLVSFEPREEYYALVGAETPSRPILSADLMESPAAEPLALEPLPAPTADLGVPVGEFKSLTATEGYPSTHRIGPIERGAQLWPIAWRLRDTFNTTTEQVMVGLFQTNPESFCYRNLNCLKVGAYLDPPSVARVAETTPSEARRIVQRQSETWLERNRRTEAVADTKPKGAIP